MVMVGDESVEMVVVMVVVVLVVAAVSRWFYPLPCCISRQNPPIQRIKIQSSL